MSDDCHNCESSLFRARKSLCRFLDFSLVFCFRISLYIVLKDEGAVFWRDFVVVFGVLIGMFISFDVRYCVTLFVEFCCHWVTPF